MLEYIPLYSNRKVCSNTPIAFITVPVVSFFLVLVYIVNPKTWYPLTCRFSSPRSGPKILAGGTSGSLLAWDHAGEQIFETALTDDPVCRLSDIFTMAEFRTADKEIEGGYIIAGSGPSVHLISRVGYSYKRVLLAGP